MYAFTTFTAAIAAIAPFAAAWTQPVGDEPEGNPIYNPGLGEIVPVGTPYTIVWDPTTEGTVTLVLLKGPSENAIPQYAIVEGAENNGSYAWTPSSDLEPTGTRGYGIQLIDDETGQYQYTTQFGIENPDYDPSMATTSSSTPTVTAAGTPSSSTPVAPVDYENPTMSASAPATTGNATEPIHWTTEVVTAYTTYCPEPTSFAMNNQTYTVSSATTLTITDCPCTVTKPMDQVSQTDSPAAETSAAETPVAPESQKTTVGPIVGTGAPSAPYMPGNGTTVIKPTGSMTVPSSLRTTATAAPTFDGDAAGPTQSGEPSEGAASGLTATASFAGLVVAAGVAVFAL
ncbi:hypothetical protein MBLNU230_g3519t1 [Neophaeotheca triangularis]